MNTQSGSGKNLKSRQSRTNRRQQPGLSLVSNSIGQTKGSTITRTLRPPNPLTSFLLYALRVGIVGLGLSVIAGTVLSTINFNQPPLASLKKQIEAKQVKPEKTSSALTPANNLPVQSTPPAVTKTISSLETKLQALIAKNPKLEPSLFFIDMDNGNYVNIKGDLVFPAASTIKIPVLVAFFQDVDAGKIRLDEQLTITKDVIGSGSGVLQYQKVGTQITALETAYKMIAISDNTATNMLIAKIGGKVVVNQRIQQWGINNTIINNPLPDLEGTNTTSPKDLTTILAMVNQGQLVSLKSRDRMLGIMRETKTRTLLPQGLEKDAVISHKTGDIGTVLGDAGIIDMPNGKCYIGTVLVKRPYNDPSARTLIQDISRTVYQHLKWSIPNNITQKATDSAKTKEKKSET